MNVRLMISLAVFIGLISALALCTSFANASPATPAAEGVYRFTEFVISPNPVTAGQTYTISVKFSAFDGDITDRGIFKLYHPKGTYTRTLGNTPQGYGFFWEIPLGAPSPLITRTYQIFGIVGPLYGNMTDMITTTVTIYPRPRMDLPYRLFLPLAVR